MSKCEDCIYWTPPVNPPGPKFVAKEGNGNLKPKLPEQPGICRRYPPVTIVENQGAIPTEFNMGKAQSALDVSNIIRGVKSINVIYSAFPSAMSQWLCGEWKVAE